MLRWGASLLTVPIPSATNGRGCWTRANMLANCLPWLWLVSLNENTATVMRKTTSGIMAVFCLLVSSDLKNPEIVTLRNLTKDSAGVYKCTASNDVGEESCTVEVKMHCEWKRFLLLCPEAIKATWPAVVVPHLLFVLQMWEEWVWWPALWSVSPLEFFSSSSSSGWCSAKKRCRNMRKRRPQMKSGSSAWLNL